MIHNLRGYWAELSIRMMEGEIHEVTKWSVIYLYNKYKIKANLINEKDYYTEINLEAPMNNIDLKILVLDLEVIVNNQFPQNQITIGRL